MNLRLDHLYRETHHWEDSVAWWTNLGFRFTNQWGDEPHRAGTLVNAGTEVVLAEVPADTEASSTTFLATDNLEGFAGRLGTTVEDTHWGTQMVTAVDPDGRTYNIEREASE